MEPLIHFVVPFAALALFGVELRKALPLSMLALLPDLDALFLVHRSFTHSLIIMLSVAAPILLLLHFFKPTLQKYGFIGLLSAALHLALDVFAGFTPILWPVYGYSVWVKADLTAHIGSVPSLALNVHLLTEPIKFQHFTSLEAPLFTGEGLTLSIVLLMPFLVKVLRLLK